MLAWILYGASERMVWGLGLVVGSYKMDTGLVVLTKGVRVKTNGSSSLFFIILVEVFSKSS